VTFDQTSLYMLIADDDESLLAACKAASERLAGYPQCQLTLCRRAEEAVAAAHDAIAADRPFAVALLDLHLPPGRGGAWAAAELHAMDAQMPILLMTDAAGSIDETLIQASGNGLLHILEKPCDPRELLRLASILGQAGFSERRLAAKNRQLERLLRTSRHLVASLDIDQVLRRIAVEAKELLGAYGCAIYVLEEDGRTLRPVVAIEPPHEQQVLDTTLTVDDSFTGQAVLAGRGVVFNDAAQDPRGKTIPGTPFLPDERVLAVPFVADDALGTATLGAMCLSRLGTCFTDEDLALAETFATYAAAALKNARLYDTLQREVDERQRAERARVESAVRFQHMAEAIYEGLIIVDDGRIVYANDRICEILGRERQELLGEALDAVVVPIEASGLRSTPGNNRSDAGAFEIEMWVAHPDGSRRCLHSRYSTAVETVVANATPVTRRFIVISDITEHKGLEEQLRRMAKMEAIGRLAGGIAHDFNNLLTVINGYSQFALQKLAEDAPLRTELTQIVRAGQRAAELTGQLLTFSRRQALDMRPIDINAAIEDATPLLRRLLGENMHLDIDLASDVGAVYGDIAQLEQIIVNLVMNARDAILETRRGGGRVGIETQNVTLTMPAMAHNGQIEPGTYVTLTITDDGIGMAPETMRHLFEPFFTTKAAGQGTGLGLSTVYGIVQQFEGYIYVKSTAGSGTQFCIFFPWLKQPREQPSPERSPQHMTPGTETILVVEDEKSVRDLVAKELKQLGYRVVTAANGREALSEWQRREQEIDLVLTDLVMPEMDGHALAQHLRAEGSVVPLILMSGYNEWTVTRRDTFGEGTRYLQKPFGLDTLVQCLRATLDSRPSKPSLP
jgi:PAS domain S-box-containing protein